jgi:23S rRNA pseudouridine2605 synthase
MSEKLQKVLANMGLGSRRGMEKWIEAGRIKVNGAKATLGDRVEADDLILVDGRPVGRVQDEQQPVRLILYNKPEGQICSRDDPEGRPTVFDRLPRLKNQRWISIGRLDINTSGLLLFTTDGELANKLMHPSSQIEREYLVRVIGDVDAAMVKRLHEGVALEDGMARFTDIQDGGGEGSNHWYYVVLTEGKNREVRRLWESQEVMVSRLKRVRYGNIFIPSKTSVGRWSDVDFGDIRVLYQSVDLPVPKRIASARSRDKKSNRRR